MHQEIVFVLYVIINTMIIQDISPFIFLLYYVTGLLLNFNNKEREESMATKLQEISRKEKWILYTLKYTLLFVISRTSKNIVEKRERKMQASQAALYDLGRVSFLANDLLLPHDIPAQFVKKVCPLDTKRDDDMPEGDTRFKMPILTYLQKAEGFTTSREIIEALSIAECSVRRVLRKLEREGLAVSSLIGSTGRKRNTKFWLATGKVKEIENTR